MAYMTTRRCTCRNCGNVQPYSVYNGKLPPLNKAIATCNNCGFKSVWYYSKLSSLLSDEEGKKIAEELKKIKGEKKR